MQTVFRLAILLVTTLWTMQAMAQEWAVRIEPETIKLAGDEGDVLEAEFALINTDDWPAQANLVAVNWKYDQSGRRVFGSEVKVANDCRHWWNKSVVELQLRPSVAELYRLEIIIPDDTEEMECHFAVEAVPVSGDGRFASRYLVIYVNAEGAEPELEFNSLVMGKDAAGNKQPMVVIKNTGTAHSKLYGLLEGEDEEGQDLDVVVRSTEILAGETRAIPLLISKEGGGEAWWSTPLEIDGSLNWDGGEIDVEGELH